MEFCDFENYILCFVKIFTNEGQDKLMSPPLEKLKSPT
jgi:hypothetical protein